MDEVDSAQPSTVGHVASGDRQTSAAHGRQDTRNDDLSPPDLAANADDTWTFDATVHESPRPADPVSTGAMKGAEEASGNTPEVNGTKREEVGTPSTMTTGDEKSDLPLIGQKQDETSGKDTKNGKQSTIHQCEASDQASTADTTKHEPSPNIIPSIHKTDNPGTVAGVTKQDGDAQSDIADTWFRAVISGEAESVQTVLPLITDVNIRDQVMNLCIFYGSILFFTFVWLIFCICAHHQMNKCLC